MKADAQEYDFGQAPSVVLGSAPIHEELPTQRPAEAPSQAPIDEELPTQDYYQELTPVPVDMLSKWYLDVGRNSRSSGHAG